MSVRRGGRQILLHGLGLVLAGLVWGLFVPHTPYPRLALTAHVQFEVNGLLVIIMALLLLNLPHRVRPRSVAVMVCAAWLAWPMGISEIANAWWGASQIMPIAAAQAGATGAAPWQESLVQLTHVSAALGLLMAWTLLVIGFARKPAPQ